jgi:hypothetical protein
LCGRDTVLGFQDPADCDEMVQASEVPARGWRSIATLVLAAVLAVCCLLLLFRLYTSGGLRFEWLGISFSASNWIRPAVVGALAWLGLAWLHPRLRIGRDGAVPAACLFAYAVTYHPPYSFDVAPSAYTAMAIATGDGASLDRYSELVEHGIPYYLFQSPRGVYSSYPLGPALLAWPVFLPAPLSDLPRAELAIRLGNVAAILIAVASVWLALQIARRLDPPFSPHLVALVYGLGTTHWSTSASALWQHGSAELWILGALERFLDRETPPRRRLLGLGACLALSVVTRPSFALYAVLIVGMVLWKYRLQIVHVLAGGAALSVPALAFYLEIYGSVLGPYAAQAGGLGLRAPREWLENMFWLIASPSRGVLWYEPVVCLTLLAAFAAAVLGRGRSLTLWLGLVGFGTTLALYGNWYQWWGGYSFGPRLMTDALPWWLLAVSSMGPASSWLAAASVATTAAGAAISVIGAAGNPTFWDDKPPVNWFPDRLETLSDSQLLTLCLSMLQTDGLTRAAIDAETRIGPEAALDAWGREWEKRPWHRFAAFRIADLMIRTDRPDEALAHAKDLEERDPGSSYVRHLVERLPPVLELMEEGNWKMPAEASARVNGDQASNVLDSRLSTKWSTGRPQVRGDWVELSVDPALPLRGVALIYAPDFGEGPMTLLVAGTAADGTSRRLGQRDLIYAPHKGWIVIRFPPVLLRKVRVSLKSSAAVPWTVTEARVLLAEPEPSGSEPPRVERPSP